MGCTKSKSGTNHEEKYKLDGVDSPVKASKIRKDEILNIEIMFYEL